MYKKITEKVELEKSYSKSYQQSNASSSLKKGIENSSRLTEKNFYAEMKD